MNTQELFDKVANHLLKQNARAQRNNECVLRDNRGRACAWGCLIPESEYKQEMDSTFDAFSVIVSPYVGNLDNECIKLMIPLRLLHDHVPLILWREELITIAAQFNLSTENLING